MVNNIPRTKIWEVRSRNTTRVLFESIVPDQLSEERYRGVQGNDTEVGGSKLARERECRPSVESC